MKKNVLALLGLDGAITLHPWQQEVYAKFIEDFKREDDGTQLYRTALCGAHGTGKTMLGALIILTHLVLSARRDKDKSYRCVVYAGSEDQLKIGVWAELSALVERSQYLRNILRRNNHSLYLKDHPSLFFVESRVCNRANPHTLAGVHGENKLVVADEATTICDAAFDKMSSYFTEGKGFWLAMGNPVSNEGFFYNLFHEQNKWYTRYISRAEATTENDNYSEEIADKYGDDSDEYRIKVLGIFPTKSSGGLFPGYLIDDAMNDNRPVREHKSPYYIGIDVASDDGANYSAVVVRDSSQWIFGLRSKCTHEELKHEIERLIAIYGSRGLVHVAIDAMGVGFGLFDHFRIKYHDTKSVYVMGVKGGEKPKNNQNVANRKTELYFLLREWMKNGGHIPVNLLSPQLTMELKMIKTKLTTGGLIAVESKTKMDFSPDLADALSYTFAFGNNIIDNSHRGNLEIMSTTKYYRQIRMQSRLNQMFSNRGYF